MNAYLPAASLMANNITCYYTHCFKQLMPVNLTGTQEASCLKEHMERFIDIVLKASPPQRIHAASLKHFFHNEEARLRLYRFAQEINDETTVHFLDRLFSISSILNAFVYALLSCMENHILVLDKPFNASRLQEYHKALCPTLFTLSTHNFESLQELTDMLNTDDDLQSQRIARIESVLQNLTEKLPQWDNETQAQARRLEKRLTKLKEQLATLAKHRICCPNLFAYSISFSLFFEKVDEVLQKRVNDAPAALQAQKEQENEEQHAKLLQLCNLMMLTDLQYAKQLAEAEQLIS